MEDVWEDLLVLRKLYGLLQNSNMNNSPVNQLDERSRNMLRKLLDDATHQKIQQSKKTQNEVTNSNIKEIDSSQDIQQCHQGQNNDTSTSKSQGAQSKLKPTSTPNCNKVQLKRLKSNKSTTSQSTSQQVNKLRRTSETLSTDISRQICHDLSTSNIRRSSKFALKSPSNTSTSTFQNPGRRLSRTASRNSLRQRFDADDDPLARKKISPLKNDCSRRKKLCEDANNGTKTSKTEREKSEQIPRLRRIAEEVVEKQAKEAPRLLSCPRIRATDDRGKSTRREDSLHSERKARDRTGHLSSTRYLTTHSSRQHVSRPRIRATDDKGKATERQDSSYSERKVRDRTYHSKPTRYPKMYSNSTASSSSSSSSFCSITRPLRSSLVTGRRAPRITESRRISSSSKHNNAPPLPPSYHTNHYQQSKITAPMPQIEPSPLRRLKNRLSLIFHHHHHHHHHLGHGRRSPWQVLRGIVEQRRRRRGEAHHGYLHALLQGLVRHLWGAREKRPVRLARPVRMGRTVSRVRLHWWQRFRRRQGVRKGNCNKANMKLKMIG